MLVAGRARGWRRRSPAQLSGRPRSRCNLVTVTATHPRPGAGTAGPARPEDFPAPTCRHGNGAGRGCGRGGAAPGSAGRAGRAVTAAAGPGAAFPLLAAFPSWCRYPHRAPLCPPGAANPPPVPPFALSAANPPHALLSPRCHHAGPTLRVPARLQDCQVLADAEPAGGASAPAAAAELPWLPAGVGAAAAEGVPGARHSPACRRDHEGEGGGGRRGRGPAALGRCGSHLVPAGRKCAFPGDPFHCHSPASPRHLCRGSQFHLEGLRKQEQQCNNGENDSMASGIKTGKCLMFNATHSTCEIYGWCPVENSTLPRKPLLAEAENFTLFIKNTVHFTKFNFSKCNTLQTSDPSYFKSCTYDPVFNPSCPVFRVRDMVEAAGENFGDLALLGGSIRVLIEWNCDLDHFATQCQPQYSFSLQDMRYNFRTASYYWGSQQQLYRNLLKLYGIRFDLSVHGQAGKFSIVPTAVSFGTSIAFFGAATMVCDLVLLYLDAKADLYWKEKFEEFPRSGKNLVEQLLVFNFCAWLPVRTGRGIQLVPGVTGSCTMTSATLKTSISGSPWRPSLEN